MVTDEVLYYYDVTYKTTMEVWKFVENSWLKENNTY